MKILNRIVIGALLCSTAAGCVDSNGEINKQTLIGLTGAAAGGIIGSNVGGGHGKVAAIIGGTLLGNMLGSEVGKSLDRNDIAYHSDTQLRALESNRVGTVSTWTNPDTGARGSIIPTKTYERNHQYCREFNQTIEIGGRKQQGHGTACRNPDGTWEMQNQASPSRHMSY